MTASNDLTTAYGLMVRHLAGEPPPSLPQPAGRRYRRLTDGDGTDPVADEWDAQQSRTRPAVPSNEAAEKCTGPSPTLQHGYETSARSRQCSLGEVV